MNRKEAESILRNTFHLNAFYDEQWTTIEKVLNGERVLLIEKTGYGKSRLTRKSCGLSVYFS
jgi:ATP-dependent DNA helicase RecQ